jgi:hypothetical protein
MLEQIERRQLPHFLLRLHISNYMSLPKNNSSFVTLRLFYKCKTYSRIFADMTYLPRSREGCNPKGHIVFHDGRHRSNEGLIIVTSGKVCVKTILSHYRDDSLLFRTH